MNTISIVNSPDFKKVAIEPITNQFSKGSYYDAELIIDMETGYINGPQLVAQVKDAKGKSKRFAKWKETKHFRDLADSLLEILPAPQVWNGKLFYEVKHGPNSVRGQYIHPDLVVHAAQWADVRFALKVSRIVAGYNVTAIEQEKNRIILEKDVTISALNKKLDDLMNQNVEMRNEARDMNNKLMEKNDLLLNTVAEVKESNQQLIVEVQNISNRLEEAIKRRVPPETTGGLVQIFAIVHKPGTNNYMMRRCQKRSLKASLNKLKAEGYTEIRYQAIDPNPVNTVNRIKEKLPEEIGRIMGAYGLEINDNNEFLQFIIDLDDERRV